MNKGDVGSHPGVDAAVPPSLLFAGVVGDSIPDAMYRRPYYPMGGFAYAGSIFFQIFFPVIGIVFFSPVNHPLRNGGF